MRVVSLAARLLLGLIFLIFGLNGFLSFLPMPAPAGLAGQFIGALFVSHYLSVVLLVELVTAILLLSNVYVPLALTLSGPVIVNILCFHVLLAPSGLPLALLVTILWAVVYSNYRSVFAGLFERRIDEPAQVRRQSEGATR